MTNRRRIWTLLVATLILFAALGATLPSRAQESTPEVVPDVEIETTRTTRDEAEATPDDAAEDDGDDEDLTADEEVDAGAAAIEGDIAPGDDLVVAQGLAIYDEFDEGKWWLTEIEPLGVDEAGSTEAPDFGFLLQIEGATIIRNDLTGKRARIEPGEAYYLSAGDPYTRYADGSGSRAWLLEIVPADRDEDDSPGSVRYDSSEDGEPFGDLPSSVRDFELTAGTLAQGESVDVEGGDAPSLVVLVSGSLTVSDGRVLNTPAGYAFPEAVTLTNEQAADARYYVATLTSDVISGEAPAAEPAADDADTDDADTDDADTDEADAEAETDADAGADADADGEADGTPAADAADGTAPSVDGAGNEWLIENDGVDTDADGIPDDVEVAVGTDPDDIDSDNDGLTDFEEIGFTSPLFADSDEDGYDDYAEVITFGTDPNDPNDFPIE